MKKLITLLLCGIFTALCHAATETVNGITWSYTISNGEASIGSDSWMTPAISSSTSGVITIPATLGGYPVTVLGDYALCDCYNVTSVSIPSTVTVIGNSAFEGCGLTSITIPSSVTAIGSEAFYRCSELTSVTISEGIIAIGDFAFSGCEALESITIPSSVKQIGNSVFSDIGCLYTDEFGVQYESSNKVVLISAPDDLAGEFSIPNSVRFIEQSAFYYCPDLTSVTIPSSVTSIGSGAFESCDSLTSVTILEGLSSIEYSTFSCCSALESITIPASVKKIDSYAFSGCDSLTSVTIPSSVKTVGYGAFEGCDSLTSVTISEGVKVIAEWAFSDCSKLSSVTIPSSVSFIGREAFNQCGLTSVIIRTNAVVIGESAFYSDSAYSVVFEGNPPLSAEFGAFGGWEENKGYYYASYADAWEDACAYQGEMWDPTQKEYCGLLMQMLDNVESSDENVIVKVIGEGTVYGAGTYDVGASVTLTAVPDEGAIFCGWGTTPTTTSLTYTFTMPESPVRLTAYFAPKEAIDKYVDGQGFVTSSELNAKIQEYVKTNSLISKDEVKDLALGKPVIVVKDGVATVSVQVQKASSLNGEWEDAATIEAEITPKEGEMAAFYKFVVPNEQ